MGGRFLREAHIPVQEDTSDGLMVAALVLAHAEEVCLILSADSLRAGGIGTRDSRGDQIGEREVTPGPRGE